ncbi:MAG: hypothetical protein AAF791_03095 [Bacteroidota bacterium]
MIDYESVGFSAEEEALLIQAHNMGSVSLWKAIGQYAFPNGGITLLLGYGLTRDSWILTGIALLWIAANTAILIRQRIHQARVWPNTLAKIDAYIAEAIDARGDDHPAMSTRTSR